MNSIPMLLASMFLFCLQIEPEPDVASLDISFHIVSRVAYVALSLGLTGLAEKCAIRLSASQVTRTCPPAQGAYEK